MCLQRVAWDSDDELLRLVLDAGADVNLEGGLYDSPRSRETLARSWSRCQFPWRKAQVPSPSCSLLSFYNKPDTNTSFLKLLLDAEFI